MAKMKPIPKLLTIILVVGAAFLGFMKFKDKILPEGRQAKSILSQDVKDATAAGTPLVRVGVVTWGGYAGGQFYNGGFQASKESRYYKDYNILVEFKVIDDFTASRNAFKNDEIDLLWATIDAFASEADALKEYQPVFVMQADWSRGGDAIVATNGIKSVRDLKGKKIALAVGTPSHTFLLSMLQADDMEYNQVEVVGVDSAVIAAQYFKQGKVDAAVVWSPDDADCVVSVPGAHILKSTREATNIIADGFFAKRSFVESHRREIQALYEGWMKGAAEINSNPAAKKEAIKILTVGLNIPDSFAEQAINNVRLTTHGDNVNFFGLNPSYKGVTGEQLYNKMAKIYNAIGLAPDVVPHWRQVNDTTFIKAADLSGSQHAAETGFVFTKPTAELAKAEEFSSKTIRVTFEFGSSALDENGKVILDMGFADVAKQFGNARIRVVGHTDNIGSDEANQRLSEARAKSVANYLTAKYGFDRNRFVIVGKGPSDPVADNSTERGRAQNRRTEMQLL